MLAPSPESCILNIIDGAFPVPPDGPQTPNSEEAHLPPAEGLPSGNDATVQILASTRPRPRHSAESTAFLPEQVVADRFRIIRFIAKGGMGEVYEAEDLELKEPVALKTVLPDAALDRSAVRRFTREIALSRKVTHPNACRIFDLFHHLQDGQDIIFLSMELLSGETLAERIRRTGPMPLPEALPIIHQMAGALAAAHQAGIVHRDLKPNNVMLVPAPGIPNGVRAVVTDFGLAVGVSADSSHVTVSATGEGFFVGTPAYMAPEQVQGKVATQQSDIYAFGLVLYEMVTGQVAFTGTNPLTVATMRLTEPPPAPDRLVPNLDPALKLVIARCLERDPNERWPSMVELQEALGAGSRTALLAMMPTMIARTARRSRKPLLLGSAALGLLLLGSAGGYVLLRGNGDGLAGLAALSGRRQSVAVLGFKDLRGQAAWLAPALTEMVTTELAAGESLRLVPPDQVARTRQDLGLVDLDSLPPDGLKKLYLNLGTDFLVNGSFLAGDGTIRLDLKLLDATSGETLAAIAEMGPERELTDLVSRAGVALRRKLHLKTAARRDNSLQASLPRNTEAARCYALGLDKLQNHDYLAAKDWLQKALALESDHAFTHDALAKVWSALGYDARALAEIQLARAHAKPLSRRDRALIEARASEMEHNREAAITIYRQLHEKFPDTLDYGLRLSRCLRISGKPLEAAAALGRLRQAPGPLALDPAIDLEEAQIHSYQGEARKQQEAAARAFERAAQRGARYQMAEARFLEGDAFLKLGDLDAALRADQEAQQIYENLGLEAGVAKTLADIAWIAAEQGRPEDAKHAFETALSTLKRLGHLGEVARTQNNMASLAYAREDLPEAKVLFQAAYQTYQETDRKVEMSTTLNNIANVCLREGTYREAIPLLHEALGFARTSRAKGQTALVLSTLGNLDRLLGKFAEAEQYLVESAGLCREIGDRSTLEFVQSELGLIALQGGDLPRARRHFQEAMATRQNLGTHVEARTATLEGMLRLEEGRPSEALPLLRKGVEAALRAQDPETERDARLNAARACLEMDRPAEAERLLAPVKDRLLRSVAFETQGRTRLILSLIKAHQSPGAASLKELRDLSEEARGRGALALQFETDLNLARLLARAGRQQEATELLERLQKAADASGLKHFANRARAFQG